MAAVVVAVSHGHDKKHLGTEAGAHKSTAHRGKGLSYDLGNVSREEEAAVLIQRAAFPRLIAHGEGSLKRKALLQRLELELDLQRGLRLLALCLCMFAVVIFAAVVESQASVRRGLLNTYKSLFSLDDSLADIKTRGDLLEYLGHVSSRARDLQPTSSSYFVEETAEVKLLSGLRRFKGSEVVEVAGLEARVDSPAWSITAWIQLPAGGGANVVRKPLGKEPAERSLSCWSWFVGSPNNRLEFGAHDFRGGSQTSAMQESIVGDGERGEISDGQLHNIALVVTPKNVSFFMDARLLSAHDIARPLTDCSGTALEMGDDLIPQLGEITFFARALAETEMEEIMFAGFTLQSIASGKTIFTPEKTPFDLAASTNSEAFAALEGGASTASIDQQVESTLTRQTTSLIVDKPASTSAQTLDVPRAAACRNLSEVFKRAGETPCREINVTQGGESIDTITGKKYYLLIKPEHAGGLTPPRAGFKAWPSEDLRTFDPKWFPSFCGKSASFSIWVESTNMGGYILARYATLDAIWPKKYWTLFSQNNYMSMWSRNLVEGTTKSSNWYGAGGIAYLPEKYGSIPLGFMTPGQRRHLVWTFNHEKNEACTYLDGTELLCETAEEPDLIATMDCGMDTDSSYISLGHRAPGMFQREGAMADFRMYHSVLTPKEVMALATQSTGQDGSVLRTCEKPDEGGDEAWSDINGHECSWYQERIKTTPTICSTDEVKEKCPFACGSKQPCYTTDVMPTTYSIWQKIMFLPEEKPGAGTICVREGLDVGAACREEKANPSGFKPPGQHDWQNFGVKLSADIEGIGPEYVDDDDKICEVFDRFVNPFCSFALPAPAKQMNQEIKQNGGWTIDFWWKAMPGSIFPLKGGTPDTMRRIVFFSKMYPQTVFAEVTLGNIGDGGFRVQLFSSCGQAENADMAPSGPRTLETNVWYRTAFVRGIANQEGKLGMQVYLGSSSSFDVAPWDYCVDESTDFIEGIQLPGNFMISPIEVTTGPLSSKEIQGRYYQTAPAMRLRRGPVKDDRTRMMQPIPYERQSYSYPVTLVSPPILLQTRLESTDTCKNELGTVYLGKLWNDTISGVTCESPYECDEDLRNDSTSLMSCSLDSAAPSFFGQTPLELGGKLSFYEFLQSITDAPILVRNGTFDTSAFLDAQTTSVTIAMVCFSPEYGIASTISIKGQLSTDVSVDYEVKHFQSLEGDMLDMYRWVSIGGFILAAVILAEKIVTLRYKDDVASEVPGFVVDLIVQVILPVVYFSLRLAQVTDSKYVLMNTVGVDGLAGVPWSSRDVSLGDKIAQFFEGLAAFEDKIAQEGVMATFYFIHATSALFRLIFQTSAHPRTAILVQTLVTAASDLWHFVILFLVLNFGFIALGIAQFAGEKEEFSTINRAFETLWEMLLGSMLESGAIPSSTWSANLLIMLFLIFYNFFCFMIMFNFIIAIIVEAYMKVLQEIEKLEAKQEFFTDVTSVMFVSAKSVLLRWPSHITLVHQLKYSCYLNIADYSVFRRIFPTWHRRGIISFMRHYKRYEFMLPETAKEPEELSGEMEETVRLSVSGIEERLSAMLGVAAPTQAERLMENKRLNTIGEVERQKRVGKVASKKKKLVRSPKAGRSIVPKIADSYELLPEDAQGTEGEEVSPEGVPTLRSLLAQIEQLKASDPALAVTLAQSILYQNGQAQGRADLAGQGVQPAGTDVPSAPAPPPKSTPRQQSPEAIHISSSIPDAHPMEGIWSTFAFLHPGSPNGDSNGHR